MRYSIMYDFIENDFSEKTILIVGTMEHIITGKDLYICLRKWYNKYNYLDYGNNFKNFIKTKENYNSYGILGAIRVIPYLYLNKSLEETIELALNNSFMTHNNKENENGVIALVKVLYMIKNNSSKIEIYKELSKYYDLNFHINEIKNYINEPSSKNIIPYSIVLFLESKEINDCLINIEKLKYNKSSLGIICGTMFFLKNKTYKKGIYFKYLKYIPEEINNIVIKFEERIN